MASLRLVLFGLAVFVAVGYNVATAVDRSTRAQGTDLILAVDTTGSMGPSIAAVRQKCVELVNMAVSSDAPAPGGFVLSPFNDPGIGPVEVFSHSQSAAFIAAINRLTAYDGGDTPELCLEGLLAASERGRDRGIIHVFTDAPTKNPGLLSSVLSSVVKKKQMVNFVIPNPSGFAGIEVYQEITDATSGLLITTSSNMADIYAATMILGDALLPDGVILIKLGRSAVPSRSATIPVDASTYVIDLVLTDASTAPTATLRPPAGTRSSTVEMVLNTRNTKIYRVTNPAPGNWVADIRGSAAGWTGEVRGRSPVDFSYAVGQRTDSGFQEYPGNPTSGETVTVMITPTCDDCQVTAVSFIRESGAADTTNAVTFHAASKSYSVSLRVPAESVFVKVMGRDGDGSSFERIHRTPIRPSSIRIEMVSGGESPVSLNPGESVTVNYFVVNNGGAATMQQKITGDTGSVASSSPPSSFYLGAGQRVSGHVSINVPASAAPGSTIEVLVTVSVPSSSSAINSIRKVINVVNRPRPPTCAITSSTMLSSCAAIGDDSTRCRNARYEVRATFTDPDKGLRTVHVTRENAVSMSTWSLPTEVFRISNVTVGGIATGTCCTRAVNFLVTNAGGLTASCSVRR